MNDSAGSSLSFRNGNFQTPGVSNAQRFFMIFKRMNVRLSYPRISSFTAASSSAVGLVCFQLIVCPSFSYLGIRWIWK